MKVAPGVYYVVNPKLSPKSPRLSTTLQPFRSRQLCQRCGHKGARGWIEHDHHDKPEPIYIFLCKTCEDILIEPHPRLYRPFQPNEPLPGVMDICEPCAHRDGSRCKCPLATFNGGAEPGLQIDIATPASAFVDGPKFRGRVAIWPTPATGCSGLAKRPA